MFSSKRIFLSPFLVRIFLVLFLWIGVQIIPGQGIHRSIDISGGSHSEAYLISLKKATQKMTRGQMFAFYWATSLLDDNALVNRYGKFPTARSVVIGEIISVIEKNGEEIKDLEESIMQLNENDFEYEAERNYIMSIIERKTREMKLALDYKYQM